MPYTDIVKGVKLGGFEVNPSVQDAYAKNGAATSSTELPVSILKDTEFSYERFADAAMLRGIQIKPTTSLSLKIMKEILSNTLNSTSVK